MSHLALSEVCHRAWMSRVEGNALSRLCFMEASALQPLASACVGVILARFSLPTRYEQSYRMAEGCGDRLALLTIVLFSAHLLPDDTPVKLGPQARERLAQFVSNKMTGVFDSVERFVDALTISSIVNPV